MNRRVFFQMFFLGHFIWPSFLFKLNKKPVKVIYKSVPKSRNSSYKSVNDFFYKFYGGYSRVFNRQNTQKGKILSVKAQLSSDKRTVQAEYVYKDKMSFIECEQMWRSHYSEFRDPVRHTIVSIA